MASMHITGLKVVATGISAGKQTGTHLKDNLRAHGGVAKRFKISHTTVYVPLFHLSGRSLDDGGPFRASDDKLGIFNLP